MFFSAVCSIFFPIYTWCCSDCVFCVFAQLCYVLLCNLCKLLLRHTSKRPAMFVPHICFFPLYSPPLFASLPSSPARVPTALRQNERPDSAAVWLAAASGACLSWPTYRWRPRICGRFPANPSSWLRNWATASSEKSGWVGTVVRVGGWRVKVTAGAHLHAYGKVCVCET